MTLSKNKALGKMRFLLDPHLAKSDFARGSAGDCRPSPGSSATVFQEFSKAELRRSKGEHADYGTTFGPLGEVRAV